MRSLWQMHLFHSTFTFNPRGQDRHWGKGNNIKLPAMIFLTFRQRIFLHTGPLNCSNATFATTGCQNKMQSNGIGLKYLWRIDLVNLLGTRGGLCLPAGQCCPFTKPLIQCWEEIVSDTHPVTVWVPSGCSIPRDSGGGFTCLSELPYGTDLSVKACLPFPVSQSHGTIGK